jgi:dihydroorotate dehydrogenase (fumarate)
MFNRLYQADIDPVALRAVRSLHLSTPDELLLRLRWLAILSPQTRLQLAASGGVHATTDAVKAIMAGAHAVQMVSALLKDGAHRLRQIVDGLEVFLTHEEYDSLSAMRGNMNLARAPDPSAYERSEYMHILQGWHKPFLG